MRTTLDLDGEMLLRAMAETGAKTKKAVVELGLRALLDAAARRRLAALHGMYPGASAPDRRQSEPVAS